MGKGTNIISKTKLRNDDNDDENEKVLQTLVEELQKIEELICVYEAKLEMDLEETKNNINVVVEKLPVQSSLCSGKDDERGMIMKKKLFVNEKKDTISQGESIVRKNNCFAKQNTMGKAKTKAIEKKNGAQPSKKLSSGNDEEERKTITKNEDEKIIVFQDAKTTIRNSNEAQLLKALQSVGKEEREERKITENEISMVVEKDTVAPYETIVRKKERFLKKQDAKTTTTAKKNTPLKSLKPLYFGNDEKEERKMVKKEILVKAEKDTAVQDKTLFRKKQRFSKKQDAREKTTTTIENDSQVTSSKPLCNLSEEEEEDRMMTVKEILMNREKDIIVQDENMVWRNQQTFNKQYTKKKTKAIPIKKNNEKHSVKPLCRDSGQQGKRRTIKKELLNEAGKDKAVQNETIIATKQFLKKEGRKEKLKTTAIENNSQELGLIPMKEFKTNVNAMIRKYETKKSEVLEDETKKTMLTRTKLEFSTKTILSSQIEPSFEVESNKKISSMQELGIKAFEIVVGEDGPEKRTEDGALALNVREE